jgi:hypothetical protein
MRTLALVVCLGGPWSGAARADKIRIEPTAPPQEGYQGVAPGAQGLPPHPPPLPIKEGPQRLTWSGFQVRDGVPTVFVEVTAAPDYKIEAHKGALVVTLKNTVVPLKNNRRPLRVQAFDTAVTSVEARPKGRDTQVVISLKGPVPAHRERVEAAAGGFQLLLIELPPSK